MPSKKSSAVTPKSVSSPQPKHATAVAVPTPLLVTRPLEPRGLPIPAAAQYMGVTPWTVEELVRSGKLPALRLCRNYTLLKEDLDAFLDKQKQLREERSDWPTDGRAA